jgi:predicted RND superfamily exporter protein
MTKPSFFARTTWGQPNYLLVAVACTFVLALAPLGAWRALNGTSTQVEDWLPPTHREVQDLAWYRRHFQGEQFALVSWDGCTLGDDEQLELLARKLAAAEFGAATDGTGAPAGPRMFSRVVTGPQVIRDVRQSQAGISNADAIERVEGAFVGPPQRDAQGRSLGDHTRTTCLVVDFSPAALASRARLQEAVASIEHIAAKECGIDATAIHMGGPPVDRATIDAEAQRTLLRLAPLAVILGAALCYWRLRSGRLTAIVVGIGAASAAVCLALVFYCGIFEVLLIGRPAPQWGVLDAVLMAAPAIVYLIAISAALHAANYYLQARSDDGVPGAAERTVIRGFRPTALAALAAAAAIAALAGSDVVPLQRFGLVTAASILAMAGLLYGIMPMVLHRYPPSDADVQRSAARRTGGAMTRTARTLVGHIVQRPAISLAMGMLALVALGSGIFRLEASVQLLKLLNDDADLVRDYAWLERRLGNLVPMEVVVTMPPERLRQDDEQAEDDGQQYRLTMSERVELLRQIERRLEAFPQISRALSAATFGPKSPSAGGEGDYLRRETEPVSMRPTGRELWRLNARVAAISAGGQPVDYGVLLGQMQRAVEPVLLAYQQRDQIVRALHEQGKQLAGAHVCVLFRAPKHAAAPPAEVQEQALAELLTVSGVAPRGVTYFNLASFEHPDRGDAAQDERYRTSALASLRKQDAVVLASAPRDPVAKQIAAGGVYVVNVTGVHSALESLSAPAVDDGGPRPIRAVFTGLAPVVERTQREVAGGLTVSLGWAAALAAVAVTLGLMSLASGVLAVVPALLPLAATLGVMGWCGGKTDLGIAIAAGAAIGVALEGTLHFIHWFRGGLAAGLARREAVLWAFDRAAGPMAEIALIAVAGSAALALSALTPLREFGALLAAMQAVALAGNLLVLPAMLASPLGWFFATVAMRRADPLWPRVQDWWQSWRAVPESSAESAEDMAPVLPLPKSPPAPHFPGQPAPNRRTGLPANADERRELAEGPHSALHAKLQSLRRPRTGDSSAT